MAGNSNYNRERGIRYRSKTLMHLGKWFTPVVIAEGKLRQEDLENSRPACAACWHAGHPRLQWAVIFNYILHLKRSLQKIQSGVHGAPATKLVELNSSKGQRKPKKRKITKLRLLVVELSLFSGIKRSNKEKVAMRADHQIRVNTE